MPTSGLLFAATSPPPLPSISLGGDWEQVAPGVEYRQIEISPPLTVGRFKAQVFRLDPAQVRFQVHYEPGQAARISEWREDLGGALLIVNANFFTPEYRAVGLAVRDGQVFGASLSGYGGMFQVDGAGGVRVRSLVTEPYQSGENLWQAAQGFPLLLQDGGQPASVGAGFDDPARRTMIGQDSAGRILLILTPTGQISLRNAIKWLNSQGATLDIQVAFGLDGGKSTGFYLSPGRQLYESIEAVPAVIAVYPQ
jgi:exopolysaccharide biosynthesis protein